MHPETLTFPATPAQVQKLLVELRAVGTEVIPQPDGSYAISGHAPLGKIEATASYVEPTLSVVVLKHGWNPMGEIAKSIQEHLG